MKLVLILSLTAAVFQAKPCFAQDSDASSVPVAAPSHEIPVDLQLFLQTLQKAAEAAITSKDIEKFSNQWEAMKIPDHETWFATTFGPENGAKLASLYLDAFKKSEHRLLEHFILHARPGGRFTADEIPTEPNQNSSEFQDGFVQVVQRSLRKPTKFFRIDCEWNSDKDGLPNRVPLGYVVLVDGSYRTLSDAVLRALPGMPTIRIHEGDKVQAAKLIKAVIPQYPIKARTRRIFGTVRLHAIIAKDGSVKELEVESGHPYLQPAAIDAVRQWRYAPTLVEGQPVEVYTTIDVIFAFNR